MLSPSELTPRGDGGPRRSHDFQSWLSHCHYRRCRRPEHSGPSGNRIAGRPRCERPAPCPWVPPARVSERVVAHLDACPACRHLRDQFVAIGAGLREPVEQLRCTIRGTPCGSRLLTGMRGGSATGNDGRSTGTSRAISTTWAPLIVSPSRPRGAGGRRALAAVPGSPQGRPFHAGERRRGSYPHRGVPPPVDPGGGFFL